MFLLRQRKLNRLPRYNYSSSGWYFVTICTKYHEKIFGNIINGKMILNEWGKIVNDQWIWLGNNYRYIYLDYYVIMPNHFHGIIVISQNVGNGRDRSLRNKLKTKSLSELVGAFKTRSSKFIHRGGLNRFQWQKSFYDHIIRDEKSLNNIRSYIRFNFLNWETDEENPSNTAINK